MNNSDHKIELVNSFYNDINDERASNVCALQISNVVLRMRGKDGYYRDGTGHGDGTIFEQDEIECVPDDIDVPSPAPKI